MLERLPNESAAQYHKRLVYGKLIDKTLSDIDYTELAPLVYGQEYSADVARRMMYGSCKTLELMDASRAQDCASDSDDMLQEIDGKLIELQKERQRFYDQRAAYNKVVRTRARQEELNEIIERSIREHLPAFEYTSCTHALSDNDLIVSLADIHYGIVVHNTWTDYDPDIAVQMLHTYLDRILEIARTHNSENCYVVGLGDFISGNIHLPIALANRENVVEQVMGVSELIAGFVAELSKYFNKVYFASVAGNHSRIGQKDDAPAGERLDVLIPFYIKARLSGLDNVYIDDDAGWKVDDTITCVEVRGNLFACVHGDYDSIPNGVQTLQTMVGRPLYGVLCGHKHHSYSEYVNGIRIVMAGSFVAMDEYAISKRLFSKPEQTGCVCDAKGIRCTYNVVLNE